MERNTCNIVWNGRRCGAPAFITVPDNRRGGRSACVCPRCAERLAGYNEENAEVIGTSAKREHTYSIELETMRPTLKARMELAENRFLPSSDCTVDAEFKSPIYSSLKSPCRVARMVVQRLLDENEIVIDSNCGTHFHVGMPDSGLSVPMPCGVSRMSAARNMYHSLFLPLSGWLAEHSAETVALFGRDFGGWARPINRNTNCLEHTNFVNLQHDYSIEFRLGFFANSAQYIRCMKVCDSIFSALETHFWSKYNPAPDALAERKAAADKAAKYIVRIVEKAAREALNG